MVTSTKPEVRAPVHWSVLRNLPGSISTNGTVEPHRRSMSCWPKSSVAGMRQTRSFGLPLPRSFTMANRIRSASKKRSRMRSHSYSPTPTRAEYGTPISNSVAEEGVFPISAPDAFAATATEPTPIANKALRQDFRTGMTNLGREGRCLTSRKSCMTRSCRRLLLPSHRNKVRRASSSWVFPACATRAATNPGRGLPPRARSLRT